MNYPDTPTRTAAIIEAREVFIDAMTLLPMANTTDEHLPVLRRLTNTMFAAKPHQQPLEHIEAIVADGELAIRLMVDDMVQNLEPNDEELTRVRKTNNAKCSDDRAGAMLNFSCQELSLVATILHERNEVPHIVQLLQAVRGVLEQNNRSEADKRLEAWRVVEPVRRIYRVRLLRKMGFLHGADPSPDELTIRMVSQLLQLEMLLAMHKLPSVLKLLATALCDRVRHAIDGQLYDYNRVCLVRNEITDMFVKIGRA